MQLANAGETLKKAEPEKLRSRYPAGAMLLHWLVTVLVFMALIAAWIMTSMPVEHERIFATYQFHKSLGMTIFLLMLVRLYLRLRRSPPPMEQTKWMGMAASVTHWGLYVVLIFMPVTGYIRSAADNHGIWLWGVPMPGLPENAAIAETAQSLHAIGQWFVYALIGLHIAAAIWHIVIRRDGLLNRMLPEQSREI